MTNAAKRLTYTTERPTVPGGYWVLTKYSETVMMVKQLEEGGFVVGPYSKPIGECDGWQFAGPSPMPEEGE